MVGLAFYPNLGTAEAFAIVNVRGQHSTVRAHRALGTLQCGQRPLRLEQHLTGMPRPARRLGPLQGSLLARQDNGQQDHRKAGHDTEATDPQAFGRAFWKRESRQGPEWHHRRWTFTQL